MKTLEEDVTSIAQLLVLETLRRGERVEHADIHRAVDRVMLHIFPCSCIDGKTVEAEIARRISGWPQQKNR